MISRRTFKWIVAGAFSLGFVPSFGMAREHASLVTNGISVTPTSLEAPISVVSDTPAKPRKAARPLKHSTRKVKSTHNRKSARHRKTSGKHHRVSHKNIHKASHRAHGKKKVNQHKVK